MTQLQDRLSRRRFLRKSTIGLIAPLLLPQIVSSANRIVGANDRINFGVIGVGNRARDIMQNFMAQEDLRIIALSDCRADRLASGKQIIDNHYAVQETRVYPDFRELLAQKDIDAVLIATGNRWHGLASIYAARAGKDIYCEKPVSLTIKEGRALVNTCKRHGTIYQAGTQRRSTESYQFARQMVRQGRIGRVHTVEMQVWAGDAIPHGTATDVPDGWNYDMWLGQTPWRPFVPGRVNAWQYFWDTAEGMITDMGCHYTDQMQFVLDRDDTGPIEFEGQAEFPDPGKYMSDTPVTAEVRARYADDVVGVMYQRKGFNDRYIRYIGDEGWIQVDDATDLVTAEPKSVLRSKDEGGQSWANAGAHIRNLLDSIRSRRPAICNPEVAHRAITICQAMNISLRLGTKLRWDPVKEVFNSEEANRMLWREPRAPWSI